MCVTTALNKTLFILDHVTFRLRQSNWHEVMVVNGVYKHSKYERIWFESFSIMSKAQVFATQDCWLDKLHWLHRSYVTHTNQKQCCMKPTVLSSGDPSHTDSAWGWFDTGLEMSGITQSEADRGHLEKCARMHARAHTHTHTHTHTHAHTGQWATWITSWQDNETSWQENEKEFV